MWSIPHLCGVFDATQLYLIKFSAFKALNFQEVKRTTLNYLRDFIYEICVVTTLNKLKG